MLIVALILLGLFTVYVINNNVTKPKPAGQNVTLSLGSTTPTQSQKQTLVLTPSPTSKANNILNEVTAVSNFDTSC